MTDRPAWLLAPDPREVARAVSEHEGDAEAAAARAARLSIPKPVRW